MYSTGDLKNANSRGFGYEMEGIVRRWNRDMVVFRSMVL